MQEAALMCGLFVVRHSERSEAIQTRVAINVGEMPATTLLEPHARPLDCFASLAMTILVERVQISPSSLRGAKGDAAIHLRVAGSRWIATALCASQ
jgi:hypothetical protein